MVICLESIRTYVCPYCTYDLWPFEYMSNKLGWETVWHLFVLGKCATVLIIVLIREQDHSPLSGVGAPTFPCVGTCFCGECPILGARLSFYLSYCSVIPAGALTKPQTQAEPLCLVKFVWLPPAPFHRTFHTESHLNFYLYFSSLKISQILVMLGCRFLEDNYDIMFLYSEVHPCLAHRGLLCKQPVRNNGSINQSINNLYKTL